jgi:hypothetical protein
VEGIASAVTSVRNTGVLGTSNATGSDAAGVRGRSTAATGQVYGVHGLTESTTDGASGVRGESAATLGAVFGVHGSTGSNAGNAAGVKGTAPSTSPAAGGFANYGVWGRTDAGIRTVGVQGDAYSFGSPAKALEARVGVRGYAGPYGSETTKRVGVEGDVDAKTPNPFTVSGVRGVNRGSISATGYAGVVGQALSDTAEGPAPDPASVGHVGVWGVAQSGVLNSAGVVGEATVPTAGMTYGVWGRSSAEPASAAGVLAQGNGAPVPGTPRAAALELRNGAIRVSGDARPAGTVPVPVGWMSVIDCPQNVPGVIPPSTGTHTHVEGFFTDAPLLNPLIVPDTIITATVENLSPTPRWAYSVNVQSKVPGSCVFRVYAPGCPPPDDPLVVHYVLVNPAA